MRKQDIKEMLIASYTSLMEQQDCPLVGLAGGQGIGKSYLAQELKVHFGDALLVLSLDDFYLTKAERDKLAAKVHPLFATRGVPGTHDLQFLRDIIEQVEQGSSVLQVPHFIKAKDERAPKSEWREINVVPKLILLEGWCVGAMPQDTAGLQRSINKLEREHDPDGRWRHAVNDFLTTAYVPLWQEMVHLTYLKPAEFEEVQTWRWQQEVENLAAIDRTPTEVDRARVIEFIQYYERISCHMMKNMASYDVVVEVSGPAREWQQLRDHQSMTKG